MNTTDLFKFNFVDRSNEQVNLNDFLNNNRECTLWIKGDHGVGKTKFLYYVFANRNDYVLCYLDIKDKADTKEVLSAFVNELQNHCNIEFLTSVKSTYKHFYNTIYKNTKEITDEIFPKISNIISVIMELGNFAVTKTDENKNPLDLICDYIELILKRKKLCLCIDNFSRCNDDLLNHFFYIFKKFLKNEKFKSCIITASEETTEKTIENIHISLPFEEIKIDKFQEVDYFYEILNPIFNVDHISNDDLIYMYNKCDGSPQKLSTLISKLLEKGGITIYKNQKALIDKSILISILQKETIKFRESDFSDVQKWILFAYLCLSETIEFKKLKDFSLYIAQKIFCFQTYNESLFDKEFGKLWKNRILNYNTNNDTVSAYHYLDYIELSDIFKESQIKGLFHRYSYEFLLNQSDSYPLREKLLCYHSSEAEIGNWKIRNFRYGKKLFYQGQIYDALNIFSQFDGKLDGFHPLKILFIAIVSYETGNYKSAIQKFNIINPESLKYNRAKYYYYFYLGKSHNNEGNINKAIEMLNYALKYIEKESILYIQTLNILHMYYFELSDTIEESQKIFNFIRYTYKEKYPVAWANTMRGCQNFLNEEECLEVLEEADKCLDNELEKAFLKTTKGFVLIKSNQISEAEKEFEKSCKVIKRLKLHEFSYAANNLAVCYMLKHNYNKAKEVLMEALLWNKTNYGRIVIRIHLMVCCTYMSLTTEALEYYTFLEDYVNNNSIMDPIMNRKIYLNLAIVSIKLGKKDMAKKYFTKAAPFIKNSSSEWRYNNFVQKENTFLNEPTNLYIRETDFDPWFLIYAHD